MGYAIMLELKEPIVCNDECEHRDCAYTRKFVSTATCSICENKIEVGSAYYGTLSNDLQHFSCLHVEVEFETEN